MIKNPPEYKGLDPYRGASRFSKPHRRIRSVAVLPSLMTLANGVFGFASIHFAARGMNQPEMLWLEKPPLSFFAAAAWMIFFAMVADVLDGFLARRSGTASNFGGQLDSLCDVISFGVAPAFLMLRFVESHYSNAIGAATPAFGTFLGKMLWMAAAIYFCCAALRLARFNVENSTDETSHMNFSGLPSPAAAGWVASMVLLLTDLGEAARPVIERISEILVFALPFMTVAAGLLMVSRFPYKHVVNQYLHGKRPFRHVVYVVLIVLALWLQLQLTAAVGFLAFASSGVVRWAWKRHHATPVPQITSPTEPSNP